MSAWPLNLVGVSRRDIGAGAVAAVTALVASFIYLSTLKRYSLGLSPDARYWFGYAPQFALLAGLVVGMVVWRWTMSPASTPKQGAVAGIATAVGTVVLVPILAGVYLLLFPVLLGVATGDEWRYTLHVFPPYVQESVRVTRTVAVSWSPLIAVVLVPLNAFIGWISQRGGRPTGQ
jgi:hypothetical protein